MSDTSTTTEEPQATAPAFKNKEQVRDFLIHAITKNKLDIAHFLFEKCSVLIDEIFADQDKKLHNALVYASDKGYTEIVDLILEKGEGKLNTESIEAAFNSSSKAGQANVKDLLFKKVNLSEGSVERLMYSCIENGDLDAVQRLFEKAK